MKTRNFLSLLLTLLSGFSFAQKSEVDSLRLLLNRGSHDTLAVNLYNKIAVKFIEVHPDSTIYYSGKAMTLSRKLNYSLGLANSYINAGNGYIITGKYDEALNHFNGAVSEFQVLADNNPKDTGIKKGFARALASTGVVYSEQSDHYRALGNYKRALKLYEEIKDKASISKILNNMGVIYKAQQDYDKALKSFKDCYEIQRATRQEDAATTLTNIGVIYFETGKNDSAIVYYNKAIKEFEKSNRNTRGYALLHNYLGDYYKKKNDLTLANTYYQKSLLLYEGMQSRFGASLALYNIGLLLHQQGKYEKAMPYALKSLEYAKEMDVLDQIYHSEKLISDLYDSLGNPTKAFEHYKLYIAARDSIANEEAGKKFALAEMDYEHKKKETLLTEQNKRQIQFIVFSIIAVILLVALTLAIYNRMQVKKRLTLKKEVAEYEQKALHLQMNPHFVFNCLSSISSFIVQNGTDQALKYLSKFSKLMRLTLEYSKGSIIPIDKEIESLQNYLELEQLRFHDKFRFEIRSSEKVEFNMGLPPLLVQPFVENAILHGVVPKDGTGRIEVDFDVQEGQLVCTITDNGIGLTVSRNLKQDSVMAHKSMALEITRKRLEIMEAITSKSAQIEIAELINSTKETGTKVTLRLPIQYIP